MDSNSEEFLEPRTVNSLNTVVSSSSNDLLKQTKPCPKIISRSKFEKPSEDDQIWWAQKFKSLEDKSTMPFYKRRNHLENCFSKDTLKKLVSSGIEIHPDWGQDIEVSAKRGFVTPSSLCEILPPQPILEKSPEPEKTYTNPYLNFFKKSERNAQVWRPIPKPTIDMLPLIQKAELLENKIATDFDEWFSNVGSKSKSEIDRDVILSIFEIVMSYPVMTSICRQMFEVGSVPEVTAKYLGFPEKAETACVQREIKKDILAGKMKPMVVAFNKTLPFELQRKPFTENLKEKWFEYQIRHQDIETMATVWRGITELHTTRVFLDWLIAHPEVTPPAFLLEEGVLERIFVVKSLLDLNIEELEWELPVEKDRRLSNRSKTIFQARANSLNKTRQLSVGKIDDKEKSISRNVSVAVDK